MQRDARLAEVVQHGLRGGPPTHTHTPAQSNQHTMTHGRCWEMMHVGKMGSKAEC